MDIGSGGVCVFQFHLISHPKMLDAKRGGECKAKTRNLGGYARRVLGRRTERRLGAKLFGGVRHTMAVALRAWLRATRLPESTVDGQRGAFLDSGEPRSDGCAAAPRHVPNGVDVVEPREENATSKPHRG